MTCDGLVLPGAWLGNVKLVGANVTVCVKVTQMVQVLLAAMVPVQVLAETAKSPLAVTVPMVRATVELVSVIVCAAAVFPTAVLAKVSVAGASVSGATPFPVKFTT